MEKLGTFTVYKINGQAEDAYKVELTVDVETPFGNKPIVTAEYISFSQPAKSAKGNLARFERVARTGIVETMKKFRANMFGAITEKS